MRLYAKILDNVSNINHWNYRDEAYVFEGQVNEIYLQLVDLSKELEGEQILRYMPQGTSVEVRVFFDSIDDNEEFSVTATQPFSDDKSIYKITIPSDKLPKSGNFKLTLIEDGVSKSVIIRGGVVAELLNIGSC